jgi:hypothetical protein
MAQYTVTISVDFDDCSFTYSASKLVVISGRKKRTRVSGHKLKVKTGEKVSWTCADGNFCGVFKSDSPLEAAGFAGLQGQSTDKIKATAPRKPGGDAANDYPYAVTVVNPEDGSTCTDDPDIIIDT